MVATSLNQYTPGYAIHPGEILEETLEARGMTRTAFAERSGLSLKTVSQIIHGIHLKMHCRRYDFLHGKTRRFLNHV